MCKKNVIIFSGVCINMCSTPVCSTGGNNADCFDYELDLNTNPVIMEKIGYSGDLYLLVKSLYERESGDFKKRASHNNAVTIYEALSNFSG